MSVCTCLVSCRLARRSDVIPMLLSSAFRRAFHSLPYGRDRHGMRQRSILARHFHAVNYPYGDQVTGYVSMLSAAYRAEGGVEIYPTQRPSMCVLTDTVYLIVFRLRKSFVMPCLPALPDCRHCQLGRNQDITCVRPYNLNGLTTKGLIPIYSIHLDSSAALRAASHQSKHMGSTLLVSEM